MRTLNSACSHLIRVAVTCVGISAITVVADDWPHWRGPLRRGISAETQWADTWNGAPKIAWKSRVGLGYSSFVVAEGRAFTAGHADGNDTVFAFDAVSGKELWRHSYPSELGDKFFDGGTTGTPTVHRGKLYWLSRWGDLFCFDAATGKVDWSKNIQQETGVRIPDWGFSGAPLVHEELLILNVGESGVAVEKATGKLVWKSADDNAGYSTPVPILRGRETLAVMGTGTAYTAVNVRTGKPVWSHRWLTDYGVNAADPIFVGDRVFISSGYNKGATLIDLGAGEPREVWKSKVLRTQMNAGVLHNGHVYGVDGNTTAKASLKCVAFETGEEKWNFPNFGSGGVMIAGDKFIGMTGTGELIIAPVSAEGFKPTARAQVLGGKIWTVPVLANGIVYCRNSRGDVAAVDLRKP